MSTSEAELTLVMRARNLASGAIADLKTSVAGIETNARKAGDALTTAFAGKGRILANELGMLVTNVLNGQDFGAAGVYLGATIAGGVASAFGEQIIARIAGSQFLAGIGTSLAIAGEGIGSLIATAIPIGMAIAPALILAAVVAAIAFLIANPDIRDKVLGVAGDVVRGIVDGLVGLGGAILGAFATGFRLVVDATATFVGKVVGFYLSIPGKLLSLGLAIVTTIIDGMVSFPGKVADIVREAFANLKIDVGPFHISGRTGVTIDLPSIDANPNGQQGGRGGGFGPGNHAGGGWVGLHGPELSWLGEQGPEYVVPNHQLGGRGGMGVRIEGVTEEQILDIMQRGLYVRLRQAPS